MHMAMRRSSVIICLLVLASNKYVSAMVAVDNPRSSSCTRRNFIPKAAIGGAISGFLLGETNGRNRDARAAEVPLPNPAAPPRPPQPIPIPIAGIGGAPLRPVVFDRAANPWEVPRLSTRLGQERIGARELSPLNPSLSPFADNDLFYPESFVGEWNVRATLQRKSYPYGLSFVPTLSLVEGSPRYRSEAVEDSTAYQVRYYPLDGNDGAEGKKKIITDRRFNSLSASRAYNQLTPVENLIWDPRKDPTVLKIQFAPGGLTQDMMPIGPRRAEVYITARKKEEGSDKNKETEVFAASERTRQVTLGAGSVDVFDTESITEYEITNDGNTIHAVQRIAVYLTPNPNSREGVLWQQVGGKAIAFFDYVLEMQKA